MTWLLLEARYTGDQVPVHDFKELISHREDLVRVNIRQVVKSHDSKDSHHK